MATDPKINLIASEAAKPSSQKQQDWIEQPLRRRKAGEQYDRLAFEEGPDERDQIGIGAVFGDQPINIHSNRFPPRLLPQPNRSRALFADPPVTGRAC